MTKWLIPLALLCALAGAQTTTPTARPHQNFVDNAGNPCALCTLGTFAAGTTTPQPTWSDASRGAQNQNPIILDIAGGANIWVDPTLAYKFVLKDALGSTIWTVDNVKSSGGGAVPCSTPSAIQIANSDATALACDPTITIDTTGHAILVGGAITGPAFTLKNLTTIPFSWTLDITSPTTALNSLGAIPLGNLAAQPADTVAMNASGGSAAPTAVPMPAGCTNGVNYSTVTHSWTCAASSIPLSSLAQQGPNTVVMNPTSSTASPIAVNMPSGCTNGVNYNSTSGTWSCITAVTPKVCTGTTPPWSCYVQRPDGTLEEWGTISVPPSGSDFNSATITFPLNFTNTPAVTITTVGQASFSGDPTSPPCSALQTISTSGATAFMMRCIIASAGGGHFDNTITLNWHAID